MTTIYSNGNYIGSESYQNIRNITFNYTGNKVYSANKVDRLYGIFVSDIIVAPENFLKWNILTWEGLNNSNTKVFFFIKSASTELGLSSSSWVGPFQNYSNDISLSDGIYMQFMAVLRNDADIVPNKPIVDRVNLSFYSTQDISRFFTRTFDVGFVPKQILLTYNATNETDDTIIRFAVSGEDTADETKYQYIDPNKLESLDELAYDSSKIKVMLEFIGTSAATVSIDEFGIMFSGEKTTLVNEIYMESSSTSSSTSSSSLSSSSSSSIDSSSSSSIDSSSTSSSSSSTDGL